MRVKCIISEDDVWMHGDINSSTDGPRTGEIVTVIGDVSEFGYDLKEYPCPDSWGWDKRQFVPVDYDDITEQLAREAMIVDEVPDVEEIKEYAFSTRN